MPEKCRRHCCTQDCDPDEPGHFIGASKCKFILHDGRGPYCISTIGAWYPIEGEPMTEIGYQRFYETYVFDKRRADGRFSEIARLPANSEDEARSAHTVMLERYEALAEKETADVRQSK